MTLTPQENSSTLTVLLLIIFVAVAVPASVTICLYLQLKWRGGGQRPRYPKWATVLSYFNKRYRFRQQAHHQHTDEDEKSTLPLSFHNFIRNDVIDIFNQQRTQGDQFAVLLFIPQGVELDTIDTSVNFYTTDIGNERCLTHASYPFWPIDPQNFGNFMVARPEHSWSQHAEEILLENFPKIWETYQQREGGPPKYVILYSWMMPCARKCTPKLIECIASDNCDYTKSTKFIVAHTIHWYMEEMSAIRASKRSLHDSDVTVERVSYDRKLSPSFEEQRIRSASFSPQVSMPPIDRSNHINNSSWNESDMGFSLDKLRDLNLDYDSDHKQSVTPTFQKVDTPSNVAINQMIKILPADLSYRSDSPWEGLSEAESTETDLNLDDVNDWPLLTKEQKFE